MRIDVPPAYPRLVEHTTFQQRQTAFSLTRQGLDSIVDDLALSDSDDEDETSINEPGAGAPTPSASSLVPQTAGHDGSHGAPSKKTVSRKIKRKVGEPCAVRR